MIKKPPEGSPYPMKKNKQEGSEFCCLMPINRW